MRSMGDVLHHSSDGAGLTDLFTNATQLGPTEREDPRNWLGPVAHGSAEQLLTYVHEATHHWCFRSVVGEALLFLAARADMNTQALLALGDDPKDDRSPVDDPEGALSHLWGSVLPPLVRDPGPRLDSRVEEEVRSELSLAVHDDVIRIQLAQALLRPMAEGLACFAEFDAASRMNSRVWSPLPPGVVQNFAGRERRSQVPFLEPIRTLVIAEELLGRARSSSLALSRKFGVLGGPLANTANGYLPGYLAVKTLWRHLCGQDSRLVRETDLALMYMRSFFYDDLGLAAVLVAPPIPNYMISSQRILDYMGNRLICFENVRQSDIQAYEDGVLVSESQQEWIHRPGLLRSPAEDEGDVHRVRSAGAGIRSSTAMEVFGFRAHSAFEMFQKIKKRRTYLTACSVPVQVETHSGQAGELTVLWQGEPVLTVSRDDLVQVQDAGADDDDQVPQLDILLGTSMANGDLVARGAVLTRGKRVIACVVWAPPDTRARVREQMVTDFETRDSLMQSSRSLQEVSQQVVEDSPGLQRNRDHALGQIDDLVDQFYRQAALNFAREDVDIDALAESMAQDGLLAVLGSPKLLREIARLGLYAGIDPARSSLAARFRALGLDLESTLRDASYCWETVGFPPRVLQSGGTDGLVLPFL